MSKYLTTTGFGVFLKLWPRAARRQALELWNYYIFLAALLKHVEQRADLRMLITLRSTGNTKHQDRPPHKAMIDLAKRKYMPVLLFKRGFMLSYSFVCSRRHSVLEVDKRSPVKQWNIKICHCSVWRAVAFFLPSWQYWQFEFVPAESIQHSRHIQAVGCVNRGESARKGVLQVRHTHGTMCMPRRCVGHVLGCNAHIAICELECLKGR